MYRLHVLYGQPTDPAAFDEHYHSTHIPLVKKIDGLRGFTVGKCASATPDQPPPFYLAATLLGDSPEHLQSILGSPEGLAASADVASFATGGATLMFDDGEVIV